jgi:hypothetical protein
MIASNLLERIYRYIRDSLQYKCIKEPKGTLPGTVLILRRSDDALAGAIRRIHSDDLEDESALEVLQSQLASDVIWVSHERPIFGTLPERTLYKSFEEGFTCSIWLYRLKCLAEYEQGLDWGITTAERQEFSAAILTAKISQGRDN